MAASHYDSSRVAICKPRSGLSLAMMVPVAPTNVRGLAPVSHKPEEPTLCQCYSRSETLRPSPPGEIQCRRGTLKDGPDQD